MEEFDGGQIYLRHYVLALPRLGLVDRTCMHSTTGQKELHI